MSLSTLGSLPPNSSETEFTEDIWEYLIPIRGLRRTELELLVPISIIYIIIFTLGFFGNVILLWVILVNRSFHTPINYYLVNLSVSDLLILVLGLPHDLYMMWNRYPYPFEEAACRLRAFLAEASMISSVLTITVLTIERYIAIIHPLSTAIPGPKRRSGSDSAVRLKKGDLFRCCRDWGRFKKVRITVIIVWILSPLFSLPITLQVALSYIYRNDSSTNYQPVMIKESSICTVSGESEDWFSYPVLASFILFFLLPLVIITILYILILRGVRQSVKFTQNLHPTEGIESSALEEVTLPMESVQKPSPGRPSVSPLKRGRSIVFRTGQDKRAARQHQELCQIQQVQHQARMRTNKSLIRILVCIVIAFFTCFAPFHAERLLVVLVPAELWYDNKILWKVHDVLYHISGICLFANSVCNPILYNIVFRRIRAEFKAALMCCGKKRRRQREFYNGRGRSFVYRPSTISQTPKTAEF
ncbi:Pyrokinin-1 receptor [Taenia crassiceps]|uniref:Pyrokinin-1 receptor n=1 Tax=Taenia crassiceps TaxID=6207 RepID=A0ABR4QAP3_9CEST